MNADPKRFFHFLTDEGRQAILSGQGPVYDTLLEVVAHENPELADRGDVVAALRRLLGPQTVEEVFVEPAPIPRMPTGIRVGGKIVPILETHPSRYMDLHVLYRAVRTAVRQGFGDLRSYMQQREKFVQAGGSADDLDQAVIAACYKAWDEGLEELHAKRRSTEQEWIVWSAPPARGDLRLARRWGVVNNLKVSYYQFNVYKTEQGYLVTIQFRDGRELERVGLFRGGEQGSIGEAWEAAARYISDMLIGSGMLELPWQQTLVSDTTPGHQTLHLATFDYVNGAVTEARHHDPDTLDPLPASE